MTQGLISIIVPVYNAKPYLPMCIDSVLRQSYRQWELLLIDDGSTDGSAQICQQYAAAAASHNEIIRLYSCNHQGPSHARNVGLEEAEGEYVMFLDADDRLEPHALAYCLDQLGETHDMVSARCKTMREDGTLHATQTTSGEKEILQSREYLHKLLRYETIGAVWAKLYRRTMIGEVRFDEELAHGEDVMWLIGLMRQRNNSIVMTTESLYQYRIMSDSLSQRRGKIRRIRQLQHKLNALWRKEKALRPDLAYAIGYNWVEILRCLLYGIRRTLKRMKDKAA